MPNLLAKALRKVTSAIVNDVDSLPEPGDVVKTVVIAEDEVADIAFESGKSIAAHIHYD